MSPFATPLLALAAALALAAPGAGTGWEDLEDGDVRWQRVQRAGLALPPLVSPRADEARTGWEREWRLIEGRLLSLGTLPADLAAQTRAALREALATGVAPTRFAPGATRRALGWLRGARPASAPALPVAILSGHARSTVGGWTGLHLWAEGAGYAVGRRSAGYGIEGGAALSLDEDLDLTAGYRLAGYALGAHLDAEPGDVEDRIGTPFVGLDFRF